MKRLKVLGLSKWQTTIRVVLPQMFRIALPSVANESVTLVKDTALLYAVAVPELLHFAQTAVNRDFTIFPFFVAGFIYLIMTILLTMFFKWLEKRFKFRIKGVVIVAFIEVTGLKKSYGDLEVLKQITFEVEKNDVVAVIGPSGSGKSTMLRGLIHLGRN